MECKRIFDFLGVYCFPGFATGVWAFKLIIFLRRSLKRDSIIRVPSWTVVLALWAGSDR
jgi:hypothetical protein